MGKSQKQLTEMHCPPCGYSSFTRNNYFNGKLLVERDFTDEQTYHREKIRHHNQRMHGTGVVCGLLVMQHPNPVCRDRHLIIEPGTAIDCCGNEILVNSPEPIVLDDFPQVKELLDNPDGEDHRLQVCINYRECGAEQIPVLYDECGCSDTQCAPNRILESYQIEIHLDPPPIKEPNIEKPHLSLQETISVGNPTYLELHEESKRLYLVSVDTAANDYNSTIQQVNTSTNMLEDSSELGRRCRGLAISIDGLTLYATLIGANPAADADQLYVFDVSTGGGLTNGPIKVLDIPETTDDGYAYGPIVAPDGRILTSIRPTGGGTDIKVVSWLPDLVDPPTVSPAYTRQEKGHLRYNLDTSKLYYANSPTGIIDVLDPVNLGKIDEIQIGTDYRIVDARPIEVAGYELIALSVENNLPGKEAHSLLLIDPQAATPIVGDVQFQGRVWVESKSYSSVWLPILEGQKEENQRPTNLHVVDLNKLLESGETGPAASLYIGNAGTRLVSTESEQRIYVGYQDTKEIETGGIAVVDLSEALCEKLLKAEVCPSCETADCVVLATIEDYRPGYKMEDKPDSPEQSDDDIINKITRINNDKGRKWLPSTQALTKSLTCLLERGVGDGGKQGPTGPRGFKGEDGDPGEPGLGLNPALPKIIDISWGHNQSYEIEPFINNFLAQYEGGEEQIKDNVRTRVNLPLFTIYFNELMRGIYSSTFKITLEIPEIVYQEGDENEDATLILSGIIRKFPIYGTVIKIDEDVTTPSTNETAKYAAVFIPHENFFTQLSEDAWLIRLILLYLYNVTNHTSIFPRFYISLKGDFIWAGDAASSFAEEKVLDADNIGGMIGKNQQRNGVIEGGKNPSGNLTQGGNFESWLAIDIGEGSTAPGGPYLSPNYLLNIRSELKGPRVNVNMATEHSLMMIKGMTKTLSKKIISERKKKPFSDVDDMKKRVKLSEQKMNEIRRRIVVI